MLTARKVRIRQAIEDWAVGIAIGLLVFGAAGAVLIEAFTLLAEYTKTHG